MKAEIRFRGSLSFEWMSFDIYALNGSKLFSGSRFRRNTRSDGHYNICNTEGKCLLTFSSSNMNHQQLIRRLNSKLVELEVEIDVAKSIENYNSYWIKLREDHNKNIQSEIDQLQLELKNLKSRANVIQTLIESKRKKLITQLKI